MIVTDENYSYLTTLTLDNAFQSGFCIEIERTLTGIADELTNVNILVSSEWRTPNANAKTSYYNVPWIGGLSKQKATIYPILAFDIGDVPCADVQGFLYSEMSISVNLGELNLFTGVANGAFRDRTEKETAKGYGVNVISQICTGSDVYAVWLNRGGVFYCCPLKLKSQANTLNDDGFYKNGDEFLAKQQNRSSIVKTYETPPIVNEWKEALRELGAAPFVQIYEDIDGRPEKISVSGYTEGNTQATFTATYFNKIY